MTSEVANVVIIGAGVNGLIAAKTYLQVDPSINLLIVDAAPAIGGTWAEHRLYPGLKTQCLYGTYEFSDLPMHGKAGEHIPGQVVHDYIKQYAEKFDLVQRIRCNTKVEVVERVGKSWRLTATGAIGKTTIVCDKLIVAAGLTSEPLIPAIPGSEIFDVPIVHSKTLGEYAASLLKSASSVTVYGAKKSAQDAVYLFASNGIKVNWVIRKSAGSGPGWSAPTKPVIPGTQFDQVGSIRAIGWLSPCVWGNADGHGWIRWFLHRTRLGRWLTAGFWTMGENYMIQENGYDSDPKLQRLKPWCRRAYEPPELIGLSLTEATSESISSFWGGASLGALNFSTNFFELIKSDKVEVHITDITALTSRTIHLSTGEAISADALICCTGWLDIPAFKVLPEGIQGELGMPYPFPKADALVAKADKEILSKLPMLAAQPPMYEEDPKTRPFRLYRFIAPPTSAFDRSIAFVGVASALATLLSGELQALWAVAYLTGRLDLEKRSPVERATCGMTLEDERLWETVLATRFGRWRSPAGYGARFPELTFDAMPYHDLLLRDLGLEFRRKRSWLRERFTPYNVKDYEGIVDEWLAKIGTASPPVWTS
ncbi:hypothetical protein FRB96_002736 [Tulasnella sp. 330]|nr:hypothetical protein FRB96_002736 [Tulasnella sp. 330]KAG8868686.1 hypothetical protein FRB97_002071 [Tulasnella sp. 331]